MTLITHLGEMGVVLVLAGFAGALAWRRARRDVIAGGVGLVAALAAAHVLKHLVNRPRPTDAVAGPSFPSGHATAIFGLAAALSVWWPRGCVVWWSVAVVVAGSRLVLGVHFPSDCLAGAVLGAGVVWIAIAAARTYTRQIQQRESP